MKCSNMLTTDGYAAPSFCFGWSVCLVSRFSLFGFPSLSLFFFSVLACLTAQAKSRIGDIVAAVAAAAAAAFGDDADDDDDDDDDTERIRSRR